MDFVVFTSFKEKRKQALLKGDVESFYEEYIDSDGAKVKCVKVCLKNDEWIRVAESFEEVLKRVKADV